MIKLNNTNHALRNNDDFERHYRELIYQDPQVSQLATAVLESEKITIYNYLINKKLPRPDGLKPVLKTEPYVHIIYQVTPQLLFSRFKITLLDLHQFFNQSLNLAQLEALSFDHLLKTYARISEKQRITRYWHDFQRTENCQGLYLHGDFNTGKTLFFKLLMKFLLAKQQKFLFLFVPDLPRQFKMHWHDEALSTKMDLLRTIPYLFLDDLGAENSHVYFRDDILSPLLQARREQQLPTFISSNYDPLLLREHFTLTNQKTDIIKATRIIQKLKMMCEFVHLNPVKVKQLD